MLRSISLFIFITLLSVSVCCQTPADWWFFGFKAGVHFAELEVEAAAGATFIAQEGNATISDNLGNLLFYTRGDTVFNNQHQEMPNGQGLFGHSSTTQSSHILQRPGVHNEYYIFTVDIFGGPLGLRYSKVDMNLNGGLGDVVAGEKNVMMHGPVSEQLTSIAKPDGYWLLAHSVLGDTFFAFEISTSGINLIPVESNSGFVHTSAQGGYLKPALNGERLGKVSTQAGLVELFDFDATNGQVSNAVSISPSLSSGLYGCEFSPNSDFFYVSTQFSELLQYDVTLATGAAISASEVLIASLSGNSGALQLGPDYKMYWARQTNYLSRINAPDQPGITCNFQDTAVFLPPQSVSFKGLPNFSPKHVAYPFLYQKTCLDATTEFEVDSIGVDSVLWNFDDPASGALNTSQLFQPSHKFTDTGLFLVSLIVHVGSIVDTVYRNVRIYPNAQISLPQVTSICDGDLAVLDVSQPYASFMWSTGSDSSAIVVDTDTSVAITVFGVCDTVSDTVSVVTVDTARVDIGPDTVICDQPGYVLKAFVSDEVMYKWSTGDTIDSIVVTTSGIYGLSATNECGSVLDVAEITLSNTPPDTLLPADTVICSSNTLTLSVPVIDGVTYTWSDSSTSNVYVVDTSETVIVLATSLCGSRSDAMQVDYLGNLPDFLGNDTAICEYDLITLDAQAEGATYLWNTGDTSGTIEAGVESRDYSVTVTRGRCESTARIGVDVSYLFCEDIECGVETMNVFSPNQDGINDTWQVTSDCDIHTYLLTIFNRWGQMVHQSTEIATGWDGYVNGQPASEGVYYYIMEFRDQVVVDVDRQEFRGSFTLLR